MSNLQSPKKNELEEDIESILRRELGAENSKTKGGSPISPMQQLGLFNKVRNDSIRSEKVEETPFKDVEDQPKDGFTPKEQLRRISALSRRRTYKIQRKSSVYSNYHTMLSFPRRDYNYMKDRSLNFDLLRTKVFK